MFQPGVFPQFWLAKRVTTRWPGLALPPGPAHPFGGLEMKHKTMFLKNKSYAYIMKKNESIDIDEPLDLEFANFLIKKL